MFKTILIIKKINNKKTNENSGPSDQIKSVASWIDSFNKYLLSTNDVVNTC